MRFAKPVLPIIIAIIILILATAPLILAAPGDSVIVPFGPPQSEIRAAYRGLFEDIGRGGRAHWAQQGFDHDGQAYAPGTVVAPEGLAGNGYDHLVVSGTVAARPALALNAEGTRVAVFRTTVANSYGSADWELADMRETLDTYLWGALHYDVLDEAALASADLSQYAILILPSVRWGSEQEVLAKLDPAALANIKAFVEAGGFLYAQSNGALIAETAGVVPTGTVDLAQILVWSPGTEANAGEVTILDPASPLTFSWLTNTLYLLTDPVYEPDDSFTIVAEYTNLAGNNQPAILTRDVDKGRVILVDGHPTAGTRRSQLPVFFNAILWATGHPAELFGDAVQVYNPALDPHLLPAYEPGTLVSVTLTFANVWDTVMNNVVITETLAEGFTVDSAEANPPAQVIVETSPVTHTLVVWQLGDVTPGEVQLNFIARTDTQALRKGEITFAAGQATFTSDGRPHLVSHQPFVLTAHMPARLQLDRDIEADRQYYIPKEGLYLDVTVPIENKEETKATNVVITDVVLLIAPIVGLDDQEIIEDQNDGETIWVRNEPFFYGETTGAPYLPADGYAPTQTITLDKDWDGAYAVFDVPYGTHFCGLSNNEVGIQGLGNCVSIPISYTNYITITADNKLLLPAKVLTWTLGEWPGYHYEEPAVRYGIHSRELFSRTVTFHGDPGIDPQDRVIQYEGGSVYTHLGDHPIFYRDHLVSGTVVYVPQSPVAPEISYQDIWSRTHTTTLRSAFYDIFSWASCASCGPGTGDRHAALNVTFGIKADTDGDSIRDEDVLVYPSRLPGADLDIVIKDQALSSRIPGKQMVIDLGVFKGLGVDIVPRSGDWRTSWSSSSPGVQLTDIEAVSPAYDNLIFQHDVLAGETVLITLHAAIKSYPDVVREGTCKLHDGARFTYRQQAAGPSRYEVYDTHVQGVLCEAPRLTIHKQGTPVQVSTYGDTLYYVMTIDDDKDPRQLLRNDPDGDPFLQSYGFGNLAATTYVGGREKKQILHSIVKPGELTRLRVEINNNSGQPLTGVKVIPQPPAGIVTTGLYTDPTQVPPPIFPDLPFLHVTTIPDAGRGVYYFDVYVQPGYSGPRGRIVEIPIQVQANGVPAGFKVPPARLGIEDDAGRVYHTYGPAQTLVLTDSLPAYVRLTGAALSTAGGVTALSGASDPAGEAAVFNTFTQTVGYRVDPSGAASFTLPGDALNRLYDPTGDHRLYVVARGTISPASAGPNWANYGAQVSYQDVDKTTWHESSERFLVEAHGAAVRVNYACTQVITGAMPAGLTAAGISADPSTCLLEAGENHQVSLQATLYNDGDKPADKVTATLTLPPGVTVLNTNPPASQVISQTVTWEVGDLAPGGFSVVKLTAFIPVNEQGIVRASSTQRYLEVIDHTNGQFVDTFSQRLIAARLADDYNLPVTFTTKLRTVYLPVMLKGFYPMPDLVVSSLTATDKGVTVVVKNIGNSPVADGFWVDVYLNPRQSPPRVNQGWQDIADQGLVWGVTQAIPAGGELTLTLGDAYYSTKYSGFNGIISPETPVWAQVDSVNLNTSYGGVLESNESNNVIGSVLPGIGSSLVEVLPQQRPALPGLLPARPFIKP